MVPNVKDLRPTLSKLFVGRVEQIRVRDLEIALKRTIIEDELWAWHNAGVFMTTLSVIYNYKRDVPPPAEITRREPSDLELAAQKLPNRRLPRKVQPVAIDDFGVKLSRIGTELVARLNGIDIAQYAHLDNGRRRMVVGNILRAKHKRGISIVFEQPQPQ